MRGIYVGRGLKAVSQAGPGSSDGVGGQSIGSLGLRHKIKCSGVCTGQDRAGMAPSMGLTSQPIINRLRMIVKAGISAFRYIRGKCMITNDY